MMSNEFRIRDFHTSDMASLYRICLETGRAGQDATGMVDQDILGHYFAAPYAVFEPTLCTVLTMSGEPVGYIVGTADTKHFEQACEASWWPVLRDRYSLPDTKDKSYTANMIRAIHDREPIDPITAEYPAHLHINILPAGQRQGFGETLIETFRNQLIDRGIRGLHFGVSRENTRAIAFYRHIGFEVLKEAESDMILGSLL
jgi:ribosomal protein S18 acetylase RimI-like enzyme